MNDFKRLAELKNTIINLVLILYARGFTEKFGSYWVANTDDYYTSKSNILDISKGFDDEEFTAELVKTINDARLEYSLIVNRLLDKNSL